MELEKFVIPAGTRRIVRHQFKNLESEEIELPEGLEWIGAHCFRNSKLRKLILPSTVTQIDFGAFSACDNLEYVRLPEKIRRIGAYAFSECEKLKEVNIPKTAEIQTGAFHDYYLHKGLCPWCGSAIDSTGKCTRADRHAQEWMGNLRLYKGMFWWDGRQLLTVKIHVCQTGKPFRSAIFFNKRTVLGSRREEWEILQKSGYSAEGMSNDELPGGRVEIGNFTACVFLHPDLDVPEIRTMIMHEFGLSKELQSLRDIRFITENIQE